MSNSEAQYIEQRAELLANLVLTRRKDLIVTTLNESADIGIDLFVSVITKEVGEGVVPSFGVEVKGTVNPLEDESSANKYGNRQMKHWKSRGFEMMPLLVFLFSMENDQGYYSWLME